MVGGMRVVPQDVAQQELAFSEGHAFAPILICLFCLGRVDLEPFVERFQRLAARRYSSFVITLVEERLGSFELRDTGL